MNVHRLTKFMDFMMNVKGDFPLGSGKPLLIALTVFQ